MTTIPQLKIVRAVQTSVACPSQWDAWTDEGTYLYLRYRSGLGTVQVAAGGPCVVEFQHGDDLDGWIDLDHFCRLAGIELAFHQHRGHALDCVICHPSGHYDCGCTP